MGMSGTGSNHSPRHSPANPDSPQSRRALRSVVSPPWNQVVRGESEPAAAASLSPSPPATLVESSPVAPQLPMDDSSSVGESLDNGSVANGNTGKRLAWNKPSNGADSEAKPVMGAVSWPALSESTRATMKLSTESPKGGADGSPVSQSQGAGITPSSSHRQVSDNANPNAVVQTRQKSIKRNGPNASFNGGHPQQSAPQGQIAATGHHNTSPRDHTQRSGFVSQNHNVNDHPQQRNSFRNRNGGPHQRGDGTHHHNYGSRREQDRGNQDWNNRFNGRDTHMSPRGFPRFMRPPPPPPPPNSGQFIPPPPVRPFGGPVGFHELAPPVLYVAAPPPDSLRGVPFVPPLPPHAMFFPAPDLQLPTKIVNQIEYYFSDDNLIRDTYLRRNMDEHGWVPIKLIAGFKKVMQLTDNVQLILDALRTSSVVEVQGDKIRRQNEWRRWIMPTSVHPSDVTGSQSLGKFSHDMLLAVQNISLEHITSNDAVGRLDVPSNTSQNNSSFGDLNNRLQLSSVEETSEDGIQGSDHSVYGRN